MPELTVVMPYFNPGPSLGKNVGDVARVLDRAGIDFEIIAVSDGSTDRSGKTIDALADTRIRRIDLAEHKGKGEALRVGLGAGVGKYLGFIDADGDLPADLLPGFLAAVRAGDVDVVIGNKRHRESEVAYPLPRRLYSWGFQTLVRVLFDLDVLDTQTGIKVFTRQVVEEVLPLMLEQGYAFDLEFLVVARDHGFRRFEELPVRIERRAPSTIRATAIAGILSDTFAVWWRWRIARRYVTTATHPSSNVWV